MYSYPSSKIQKYFIDSYYRKLPVIAPEWCPHEMSTTLFPLNPFVSTGASEFFFPPFPNYPKLLPPIPYTYPLSVM